MKLKALVRLSLITFFACLGPSAPAQSFSTIYAFSGPDGSIPSAGVTIRAGVLYGTTPCLQGCGEAGTVYQISRVGSSWAHTTLALVPGTPLARVVFGPDNHLYSTSSANGPYPDGYVFLLTPQVSICKTANCFWTQKPLYEFFGSPDGEEPGYGDLIWDPLGNIYGTTFWGGSSNLGTVYEMTKSGNNWIETPIHSFSGSDGSNPAAGLIFDSNGNLFGTTYRGGLYGYGTVFELTYGEGIGWTETVLYNFENSADGQAPYAGLALGSNGNLFGAASDGGSGGGGTVFELSPVGNTWAFKLLYSFSGQQGKSCGTWGTLAVDNSGTLYGTTNCDGTNGFGSVFKLTNTVNGWTHISLHDFTGESDGASPISNVTINSDGTLYGTASHGGSFGGSCWVNGCGVVWMIKP